MRKVLHFSLSALWRLVPAFLFLVISFGASHAAINPVFQNVQNNMWFNLTQDVRFTFFIIAIDPPENNYPMNFTRTSEGSLFQSFRLRNYNSTAAIMNFTPKNSDVGDPVSGRKNYTIYIIAEDTLKDFSTVRLYFKVANVNDPPNITWWSPAEEYVNTAENISVAFYFNYSTTDIDIPWGDSLNASWFLDSTLIDSSDSLNGSWIFPSDFCSGGSHNVTLVVSDLNTTSDSHNWNLLVNNSNRLPVFNRTILNLTWPEDTLLHENFSLMNFFYDLDYLECSGVNKDAISFKVLGSENISVSINSTGFLVTLSGSPDWFGVERVRFIMNDTYAVVTSNFVVLNITNVPDPPVLAFIPNQTLAVGVKFTYRLNATDVDRPLDVLAYWSNSSIFTVNSSTGLINFTPDSGHVGVHFINLSVTDGIFSVSRLAKFTVLSNVVPQITDAEDQVASEDVPFYTTINATDADGDNLTFFDNCSAFNIATFQVSPGVAVGVISFTPGDSHVGNHSVRVTVRDSKGAVNFTDFRLTVLDFNNQPTFPPVPEIVIKINHTYILNITATDEDSADMLTFADNASFFDIDACSSVSPCLSSTLISITNVSFVGIHYVNISVTDDDGVPKSFSQKVKFTIVVNSNPMIYTIGNRTAVEDQLFTLFINGFDPDSDWLFYDANLSLMNLTMYNSTSALLNFTPSEAQVGNYSVLVNVTDGYGGYNFTVFRLVILPVNDPPYFLNLSANYTMYEDSVFRLYVSGYDEEGSSISMWTNTSLFNLTLHNSTTYLINFTPVQHNVGNYTVNFSLTDGFFTVSKLVLFRIIDVNDPPVILSFVPSNLSVSVFENASQLFNITSAFDEDNDTIYYSWYLDGFLASSNRSWIYRPGFCDSGYHNVSALLNDGRNGTTGLEWNVSVLNTNRGPFLNTTLPNLTWPEDTNRIFNFTLTDYFYDPDFHECNGTNKDNLTYSVLGNHFVLVHIGPGSYISFYPSADWFGVEEVYFRLADTHNIVFSNNITLNVTPVNDPPTLSPIGYRTFQVGTRVEVFVNASDVDGDTLSFLDNSSFFNVSLVSGQLGLINFTAVSSMVGNHTFNISVSDMEYYVSIRAVFYINGTNLAPTIDLIYPYGWPFSGYTVFNYANASLFPSGTRINVSENRTFVFYQNSSDPDGDEISFKWLLDGSQVSVSASFSYGVGWFASGNRNLTLIVSDSLGNTDSFYWNISVRNVNRMPFFGKKTFTDLADFAAGTNSRTNTTSSPGNITLARQNSTSYYMNGLYISPAIDFRTGASSSLARQNVTRISWVAPAGSSVSFRTRHSVDSASWSAWSGVYTNATGSKVGFAANFVQNASPATWSTRFFQYSANLSTSNPSLTPSVESVGLAYEIPNFVAVEGYVASNWIDLDDYFTDLDLDNLTLNVTGIENLAFLDVIIGSNHMVTLSPHAEWHGVAKFRFFATDNSSASNLSRVYSNVVTVIVKEAPAKQAPSSGGGGGSSRTLIVTRTRLQNITQPVSLQLVVPKPLVVSSELEIIAPLRLQNTGNVTLFGINLSALTSEPNITLRLRDSFFGQLLAGEIVETELRIISSVKKLKPYSLNVTAQSASPAFKDSAIISINPLAMPQSLNDSVRFVRDLLSNNPECLELNELLVQAQKAIDNYQYDYAKQVLSNAVEACRYLISSKEAFRSRPADITLYSLLKNFFRENILPISLVGVFAVALVAYSVVAIRRHRLKH